MDWFRAGSVPSPHLMMVSVVMSKATLVPGFSCDLSNWNTVRQYLVMWSPCISIPLHLTHFLK